MKRGDASRLLVCIRLILAAASVIAFAAAAVASADVDDGTRSASPSFSSCDASSTTMSESSSSEPPSTPLTKSFFSRLESRVKSIDSHLCVGLDPHPSDLFDNDKKQEGGRTFDDASEEERCDAAYTFCKTLIDKTAPYAAAYKPNAAFFESLSHRHGLSTLRRVIDAIPDDIPVLLDVKRGDIGSTASAYADACYDADAGSNADGVTLSPLMGWDSVRPFVTGKYAAKGAFVLCKTSNPGSNDLLALRLASNVTLYEEIARLASDWSVRAANESPLASAADKDDGTTTATEHDEPPRIGLVVGATDADALSNARRAAGPRPWILAPGVGAQGGDLDAACRAGLDDKGTGLLIPVSRGISRSDDPGSKAKELRDVINAARESVLKERESAAAGGGGADAAAGSAADAAVVAPYQRDFLEFSLSEGVLRFGSFVLKSGRTSPYFFNAGLFSTGGALHRLGKAYAAAIMESHELAESGSVKFDVVFGPAYKGISLGALVCAALYSDFGVDVGYAYNRKEKKDHGEGGVLVGATMENKRVLIVDDVITAGTAIRESHTLLMGIGASPVGVVIALDRAEKRSLDDPVSAVQAVARDLAIPVVSIVSLPQLQTFITTSPDYGDDLLKNVKEYRAQYGV